MTPQPDRQGVLKSLVALARRTRHSPSRREFLSYSGIPESTVMRFFPSWNAAVRAAGLEPNTRNQRREDRELLEDWARAARKKGKIPSRRAYRHLGTFDQRTVARRFGRWSQIGEAFRKFARSKPEWADVLALLPPPVLSLGPDWYPVPRAETPVPFARGRRCDPAIILRLPSKSATRTCVAALSTAAPSTSAASATNPSTNKASSSSSASSQKNWATSSKPFNPASRTAKPSAKSAPSAGSASTSNSNSRAAISATTATPSPAAT